MLPSILFAGEYQAIVGGPVENTAAGVVGDVGERSWRCGGAVPDFVGRGGRNVGYPDGPGMRPIGLDEIALRGVTRFGGPADKGDVLAIERPRRIAVGVNAGRQKADVLRPDVIHGDETVIASAGNESQARAVGRPLFGVVLASDHQLGWFIA